MQNADVIAGARQCTRPHEPAHLSKNVKVPGPRRQAGVQGRWEGRRHVDRIVAESAKIGFSDIRKALDWGMVQTEKGPQQFVTLKDRPA